ncbi:hypothetical protein RR48_05937 [Papilio machaon]|uniref:Uncharacterized protein n=1 Tax=Papilio machaon TaxID=76193 RepID=A0A0N1ICF0_PAPMA|nr:hypothetical protein RR48_05937 [Papilio machaon]
MALEGVKSEKSEENNANGPDGKANGIENKSKQPKLYVGGLGLTYIGRSTLKRLCSNTAPTQHRLKLRRLLTVHAVTASRHPAVHAATASRRPAIHPPTVLAWTLDTNPLSGDGADGAATACCERADTAPAAHLRRAASEASTTEQSDGESSKSTVRRDNTEKIPTRQCARTIYLYIHFLTKHVHRGVWPSMLPVAAYSSGPLHLRAPRLFTTGIRKCNEP